MKIEKGLETITVRTMSEDNYLEKGEWGSNTLKVNMNWSMATKHCSKCPENKEHWDSLFYKQMWVPFIHESSLFPRPYRRNGLATSTHSKCMQR